MHRWGKNGEYDVGIFNKSLYSKITACYSFLLDSALKLQHSKLF